MASRQRRAERADRARAYRKLVASVAEVDVFCPTASTIFECLSTARLNESFGRSAALLRDEAFRETGDREAPDELSSVAIGRYLATAGELYSTAAGKCLRIPDLARAFRYYRRAAMCLGQAADLLPADRTALAAQSQQFRLKATLVRQRHARKSLCHRRLSAGILRRTR